MRFRTSRMEFARTFKKNLSFQNIIILTMVIQNIASETQETFNITSFTNHKGIYYESHGLVRTSHINWDLVAYINIDILTLKYDKLMTQYNSMGAICKQMIDNFGSVEIENTCNQFVQQFSAITLPYLYEIQSNRRNVMLSIGHNSNTENRIRRGLGNTFRRLINVLYGACSNIDTDFIFRQILELAKNKIQNINLVKEKTRVVQVETIDSNNTLQKITEHQQKLEDNLWYLQKLTKESIKNINKLEFKSKLLEQAFLFEVILNQYAYETQNLIAIINAALAGKIHTSVITPRKLLQELKEIKMNLPTGNTLPIEIIPESIPDLYEISKITIFIQNEYLVFSIAIPLLSNKEFNMYRPVPLPILYDNSTLILIEPEIEYLALSNDNEEFFSLNVKQWETCKKVETYTICKGDQPFHHRSRSNICEISLLTYQTIPDTCKIKFVTLNTPIWDKLMGTNAWLFYTQPNLVTIKCSDPSQIITIEISGVGRLTTSPNCEIHTENSIILPTSKPNRNIFTDLIPENSKNKFISELSENLKNIIPQNLKDIKIINDFNSLTRKLLEINKLQRVTTDSLVIYRIEFHVIIMYILTLIVIVTIGVLAFKFRNRIIKMYYPELPDNPLRNNE